MKIAFDNLPDLIPSDAAERYARHADWTGLKNSIDWSHASGMLRAVFGQIGKIRGDAAQLGVKQINERFVQSGRRVRYRKVGVYKLDELFDESVSRRGEVGRDGVWQDDVRHVEVGRGLDETVVGKDVGDRFVFDMYDAGVQQQLRAAQDDLIAELEQDVRDAIDQIIIDAATDGLGPEEIVDSIRDLIGLTAKQSRAAQNYRAMLESLDPDALQRQLRNFLEDDVVQAAIDDGQPLDAAMINKLTSDYIDNFLDYRAEVIATTEATRAASLGLQDAYSQAIDRGVFPAEAVKQFWQLALDEKVCPICSSIPDLNPDGVSIGESFESIDGPQDAPPDPHPGCRCSLQIITDLDLLPADDVDNTEAA